MDENFAEPYFGSRPLMVTLGFVAIYIGLYILSTEKVDPREPPVVPTALPFVGHILGILSTWSRYYKKITSRNRHPILTLPTLNSRLYIITDPAVAATAQRTKSLSFTPLIPPATKRVLGLDNGTVKLLYRNLEWGPGERGFLQDMHDMVYATLTPGKSLDEISAGAGAEMTVEVDGYAKSLRDGQIDTQNLLRWTKHIVTLSTARFLYGPRNPISQQPELESAFWDFDSGIGGLLLGLLPSVTARRAYRGRESMISAFKQYLSSEDHEFASPIIHSRLSICAKHGFTPDATARSELSFLFAGIVNTAITSCWLILQIYARPPLLSTIRDELDALLTSSESDANISLLSMSAVKNSAPRLLATFRETLRTSSDANSNRLVTADTVLADRWFLRKGSVVQIAAGSIHNDAAIWGDDVRDFNPDRFLAEAEKTRPKVHHAAFRGFGGGATLCPGRHFATGEILGLVALVVLRFEMADARSGGVPKVPRKKDNVLPVHVLEPDEEVMVGVKVREGWEARSVKLVL